MCNRRRRTNVTKGFLEGAGAADGQKDGKAEEEGAAEEEEEEEEDGSKTDRWLPCTKDLRAYVCQLKDVDGPASLGAGEWISCFGAMTNGQRNRFGMYFDVEYVCPDAGLILRAPMARWRLYGEDLV